MDLLTAFGAGATLWTAFHFLPARTKLSTDEVILKVWENTGIYTTEGKTKIFPVKKDGVWFLPYGLSLKDIEKTLPAIAYQLNAHIEMEVKGKAIIFNIFPGNLPTKIPYDTIDLSKYKLGLVIGQTRKEDCYVLDMDDSKPYIIVAGAVGMGKSNFINQALWQMTENYTPEQVKFYLIDLKLGVELDRWRKSPYTEKYCWEIDSKDKDDPKSDKLVPLLRDIKKTIKERMKLFKDHGVLKIDEYNALPGITPLPYIVLIIDEYAELRRNKDAEEQVQSIAQIGRASGVKIIMCLQRPSATNLSTDIRGLITERLTFALPDRTNSEIVLDMAGAEKLSNKGRCLLLTGSKLIEAQTMLSRKIAPS